MNEAIRHPLSEAPETGTAVELADGVLWLRVPLPMRLDHVNVYALDDGDGWTIVDSGLDAPVCRAAWDAALAGVLANRPVRRVVVTHHHADHIGLAGWFRTALDAELWTTRTAWLFARMLHLDVQAEPSAEAIAFWTAAGMDPAVLERRRQERPFNFSDRMAPLPPGFRGLREGDVFRAGGRGWDVRLGGGHAPDHITLWSRDCNLVIGGDQLLPRISPNLGVYPTEPMADPVGEWLEASRRLAVHARPEHLVLPGHKLPYTGLPLRMRQLIENHVSALERLETHLSRPHTAVECFGVLFGRAIGEAEYGLALGEAVAHVNHLWLAGRLRRSRRSDGAWLWQEKGGIATSGTGDRGGEFG